MLNKENENHEYDNYDVNNSIGGENSNEPINEQVCLILNNNNYC